MNVKGFRRMLLGEKMPDKNDPQYRERYKRDVDAGRKFAKAVGIDKAAAKVQLFANNHKNLFLIIIFSFMLGCFAWNIYRITAVYNRPERQDSILRSRHSLNNKQTIERYEDNR